MAVLKDNKQKLKKLYSDAEELINKVYRDENKVPVFGEGNPVSRVLLIGEAPGKEETLKERPFVGKAGQNLNEFLQVINYERSSLYITNVVKFRPFKVNEKTNRISNRPPTKEEIELCKGILYSEIDIISPKIVVTLGNIALKTILNDKKVTIGEYHGKPIKISIRNNDYILFPLYHPASIIYRRELKETYLDDIKRLAEYIKAN